MIPSVTLKTGESRLYSMDFAALLARGETITGVTSVQPDLVTAPPLVIGSAVYSGTLVQFRISGGRTDTRYLITVLATTSSSNTIEGQGYLQCRGPQNYTITPVKGSLALVGN